MEGSLLNATHILNLPLVHLFCTLTLKSIPTRYTTYYTGHGTGMSCDHPGVASWFEVLPIFELVVTKRLDSATSV